MINPATLCDQVGLIVCQTTSAGFRRPGGGLTATKTKLRVRRPQILTVRLNTLAVTRVGVCVPCVREVLRFLGLTPEFSQRIQTNREACVRASQPQSPILPYPRPEPEPSAAGSCVEIGQLLQLVFEWQIDAGPEQLISSELSSSVLLQ